MAKRFQYSRKNGDDIIVVESTDETWEDFMLDVERAKSGFGTKVETINLNAPVQPVQPVSNGNRYVCKTCGGPVELKTGVSKAGNDYKIMRCVNYPETVQNKKGVEGHSYFLK